MPAQSVRVRPLSKRRRARWRQLVGVDSLPVKTPEPRWQEIAPGRPAQIAYDVDVTALTPAQRQRLARYVAQSQNVSLEEAQRLVETQGVPIDAIACRVMVEEE